MSNNNNNIYSNDSIHHFKLVKLEANNKESIKLFSYNKPKKENNSFSITKIIRVDAKGNSIIKGQKKHTVTFCDLISRRNIAEIVQVDSFKQYNVDVSIFPEETGCSCKCLII